MEAQETILKALIEGNSNWVNSRDKSYFEPFIECQHPVITMVNCSDARVHATIFFEDPTDKIFLITNIGNQIAPSRGSIDFGIYNLKTPILLILGHTHCGAVKAALSNYSDEPINIKNTLDHLHIPLSTVKRSDNFEKMWLEGVEKNVDYQVSEAMKMYGHIVESGKLTIIGAVYDFTNAYRKGSGRVIIRNINGENDRNHIKNHPILKNLPEKIKEKAFL
ncbi:MULTISPECIES: carbonic anhydrase [unclassified Desulfurobacterium]|uniref:carbonic anhydrase n=1 Tax=Desulfurobacterium sp. TC5-1 TaxID=1158318 RepID=UPI0003B47553|nr:carbonic anhydrase [Desulfurobacterium sp. TC5-1]